MVIRSWRAVQERTHQHSVNAPLRARVLSSGTGQGQDRVNDGRRWRGPETGCGPKAKEEWGGELLYDNCASTSSHQPSMHLEALGWSAYVRECKQQGKLDFFRR